ncbi:MAG: tetratricopeptide repeat protein [Xanthobacteraceae bacterium]
MEGQSTTSHGDFKQALTFHQAGRLAEAEQIYRQILRAQPRHFDCLHLLGIIYAQRGNHAEAVGQIDVALQINPRVAVAHNNRANALWQLRRPDEALASCERAIALKPDYPEAFNNRGNALRELKRPQEALASYDRAIALKPNYVEAFNNRSIALRELKRPEEALASCERAIALKPDYAEAFYSRGNALRELKRPEEALASYDRAIALKPNYVEAFNNRGVALGELQRVEESLASYDRAVTLKPDYAEAFDNRGNALRKLQRLDEALASCDRALALKPDQADTLNSRGVVLRQLKRPDEALGSYDRAIALKPDYADAFHNRGAALRDLARLDEALASFDQAVAAEADHAHAFGGAADCVIKLCNWDRRARIAADLRANVSGKRSVIPPFVLLGYSDDPGLQLQCARNYIESSVPSPQQPLLTGETSRSATRRHDKVRVAYLSADFRQHPMMQLMAGLFERHDRSRFEIIGVSFGVDDASELRKRVVAAFDRFCDVRRKSDEEVARLLHDLQVDIAIDLMGHTLDSRPGILAHRPAPIQASYLGYAGTTGAEFIDYIIADKTVAPFEHQRFYTERIVHLPDCYLVNDAKRNIVGQTPSRQEAGLPEQGFVFCCFNNNWKITPDVFSAWMRILRAVDGSVLWLSRGNHVTERNLRREAQARGIDADRLVFAGHLPLYDDHLARHRLADLFLDTLPYNAHATASDALWMGLPVLTNEGSAFAGRVAASLLYAVGLPELVTHGLDEYEALALKLGTDPPTLRSIRRKLEVNRLTHPLFDTDRFRRHIEAAYATMWETWQRGESPASFAVEQLGRFRP